MVSHSGHGCDAAASTELAPEMLGVETPKVPGDVSLAPRRGRSHRLSLETYSTYDTYLKIVIFHSYVSLLEGKPRLWKTSGGTLEKKHLQVDVPHVFYWGDA